MTDRGEGAERGRRVAGAGPPARIPARIPAASGPELQLFDALKAGGAEVRLVGGCVRDRLLGRAAADIDLATDAAPTRVLALCAEAGIRTAPTGVGHGTVTALPGGRAMHVTTLRRDVETDGRHAVVAYTSDWAADAARRDFTINALSADRDGTVHDHVGGLRDLAAGRVRFVGDAASRVAEDRLRILRFFRFHARYGRGAPDADALAACAAAAGEVGLLSGERVWSELSAILGLPDPAPALSLMEASGVLGALVPGPRGVGRVAALAALERGGGTAPDPLRRLAALVEAPDAGAAAGRLALPREAAARLRTLAARRGDLDPADGTGAARRVLHDVGAGLYGDLALLAHAAAAARDPAAASAEGWLALARVPADAPVPRFPISGDDVRAAGVDEGPDVGACLRAVEEWWIGEGFRPGRRRCLDRLDEAVRGLGAARGGGPGGPPPGRAP